jgi:2,3-bisphosphoglycerate-independent phosphoglycerate mutase
MSATKSSRKPVTLVIMDGVGIGSGGPEDAVANAHTPNLDILREKHPNILLTAHGVAVGLPSDADMGNSEVGHNAMGAGAIYDQGAKLVQNALIKSDAAFQSPVWEALVTAKTLHLIGLVSDGNVHSHIDHLLAIIAAAKKSNVQCLRIHALTDGRDVAPRSALTWINPLEALLATHQAAGRDYAIASGGGRMVITMDRYNADWEMVSRGWQTHVLGKAAYTARSMSEEIKRQYAGDARINDQTLEPFVIVNERDEPIGPVNDGDSVLLFNFRGDRAMEICRAFEDPTLDTFDRIRHPKVTFAGMMLYDGDAMIPNQYLVTPPKISNTVSENLAKAGKRSIAIAETQKYGHVTYFFNGNRAVPTDPSLEHGIEIPSDNISFDRRPVMKAVEVAQATKEAIESANYDHIRVNFANGDMVGHTGDFIAAVAAVEAVDRALGVLIAATDTVGGILLVTADHGNADEMYVEKAGERIPRTSHTLSPVPFCLYDPKETWVVTGDGQSIAAIGGTILRLCGVDVPEGYLSPLVIKR